MVKKLIISCVAIVLAVGLCLPVGIGVSAAVPQVAYGGENESASHSLLADDIPVPDLSASEAEDRANSWRFVDGQLRDDLDVQDDDSDASNAESGTAGSSSSLGGSDGDEESDMAPLAFAPWTLTSSGYVNSRGEVISGAVRKGVDVSEHNYSIDWNMVKNSGDVNFAIIRAGYGQDFEFQDDKYWDYNAGRCLNLGVPFGVYLYSYADSVAKASSEADHVLRCLREAGITPDRLAYPVYYDLEESGLARPEFRGLLAQMASVFCNKVASAGYQVGVYANLNWWNNYLTDPVFNQWDRWVAQYNYRCDYQGGYHIWQCTSNGTTPGINGRVDLNFEFGSYHRDVSASDYFVQSGAYDYVLGRGWMMGYSDGSNRFGPNDSITRGQVMTVLYRMAGSPSVTSSPQFVDVMPGSYYYDAIKWAKSVGIVSGYENTNTFGPNDPVSREHLAIILRNYAEKIKHLSTASTGEKLAGMLEANMVSSDARDAFAWAVDVGLINGIWRNGQYYLSPKTTATRAQMMEMIYRLDTKVTS